MWQVFCDFDGTITNRDSIVFLTERFGAGADFRAEMLEKIKTGELSVFEVIARELATISVGWDEAVAALKEHIKVDPSFPRFVDWCKEAGYPLEVLSSGMYPVVALFVSEFGLPFHAHRVTPDPDGWRFEKDELQDKCRILRSHSRDSGKIVYIGDGTSDLAVIPYVDVLFAKKGYFLFDYCSAKGIPFYAFDTFDEVRRQLMLSGDTAGFSFGVSK